MSDKKTYDVIIIGGGPAGASAALYAERGGVSVLLLHGGVSALHKAERIENFYGAGAIDGAALYEKGIAQAEAVGATALKAQAESCAFDGANFTVTADGVEYTARRVVVASGASRAKPNISGLADFDGKGVSYCAVCDAFFYRKKRVAVLGSGQYARHEYAALSGVVGETILLTDGETPDFDAGNSDIKIVNKKIKMFVSAAEFAVLSGENGVNTTVGDRIGGAVFEDGEAVGFDGLFVAVGVLGATGIAKSLGVLTDERGSIKVDGRGMTNVDGLYAAGDCTVGIKQVAKAVCDGMTVGMSVAADIKSARKKA